MRVLTDPASIRSEIESCPDPSIARLLTRHLDFMGEYEGSESITVVVIEPGDELQIIDAQMNRQFLTNAYSGKRYGDLAFVPSFETLQADFLRRSSSKPTSRPWTPLNSPSTDATAVAWQVVADDRDQTSCPAFGWRALSKRLAI